MCGVFNRNNKKTIIVQIPPVSTEELKQAIDNYNKYGYTSSNVPLEDFFNKPEFEKHRGTLTTNPIHAVQIKLTDLEEGNKKTLNVDGDNVKLCAEQRTPSVTVCETHDVFNRFMQRSIDVRSGHVVVKDGNIVVE